MTVDTKVSATIVITVRIESDMMLAVKKNRRADMRRADEKLGTNEFNCLQSGIQHLGRRFFQAGRIPHRGVDYSARIPQ